MLKMYQNPKDMAKSDYGIRDMTTEEEKLQKQFVKKLSKKKAKEKLAISGGKIWERLNLERGIE